MTACLQKPAKMRKNGKRKTLSIIVGVVDKKKNLKHLAMVYGIDYCADAECYLKIKNQIKEGIGNIGGIQFAETKELGRVNRIDPLNITYLRVRGMWGIENPWFVFNYIYQRNMEKSFNFMSIINEDKWNSFNNTDKLLAIQDSKLAISDIKIKNPNNPARLRNAKLITYHL
ncbi:TPA: NgoPII family restriction endonuclease [Neisseria gonorrhoeae]